MDKTSSSVPSLVPPFACDLEKVQSMLGRAQSMLDLVKLVPPAASPKAFAFALTEVAEYISRSQEMLTSLAAPRAPAQVKLKTPADDRLRWFSDGEVQQVVDAIGALEHAR